MQLGLQVRFFFLFFPLFFLSLAPVGLVPVSPSRGASTPARLRPARERAMPRRERLSVSARVRRSKWSASMSRDPFAIVRGAYGQTYVFGLWAPAGMVSPIRSSIELTLPVLPLMSKTCQPF